MSSSTVGVIAGLVLGTAGWPLVGWRLRRDLSQNETLAVGLYFALGVVALVVGAVIKQVSPPGILLVIGIAPWTLLAATWGRPGVLYREWLGGSTLSRRERTILYVRLFGVALVTALIITPIMQQWGNGYG